MAECDGPNCDAQVVWAETPEGSRQPFDREPDPKGNRILIGRGPDKAPLALNLKVLSDDVLGGALHDQIRQEATYMPHHATCPDAEQFRGPRR